jgi:hypothetical protein
VTGLSSSQTPCGECHLHPGEICDICGATAEDGSQRFRDRIVEVLLKYNIAIPDAPLDMLAMAMHRMSAR